MRYLAALLLAATMGTLSPVEAQGFRRNGFLAPRNSPSVLQVQEWYQTYLGRMPDPSGVDTWASMLDQGFPPAHVLSGILGSLEYYQLKGSTPSRFVRGLYRDVLGRNPSYEELQSGVIRLSQGVARSTLAGELLGSVMP